MPPLTLTAPSPPMPSDAERIARLERENEKLRRINKVLMDRVERSMDFQGSAFSLFQTAIVLENKVRERTLELERTLHELERSNRDLARAKELAETMQTRLIEAIESVNEGFALFDADGDQTMVTILFGHGLSPVSASGGMADHAMHEMDVMSGMTDLATPVP